jgi:hypothetical protein
MDAGDGESTSVVFVAAKELSQPLTRLAALTEPKPVAKSYPGCAEEPLRPGTLLLPCVMSLKMQVLWGGPLELQFAAL